MAPSSPMAARRATAGVWPRRPHGGLCGMQARPDHVPTPPNPHTRSRTMSLKHRLRATVAGLATVAVVTGGLGSAGGAAAAPAAKAASNAPVHNCTFQTYNKGRYLTAVGGGGRTSDVLHTDAVTARSWEKFTLVDSGDGSATIRYGIQTKTGNYLTAVGGGGRITDVMHSDATQLQSWEKLTLISLGGGTYAIQTIDGHYLTAVGGGGRITDTIHSDATRIGSWEKFQVACTG